MHLRARTRSKKTSGKRKRMLTILPTMKGRSQMRSRTFAERSRVVRVPNFDSGIISEPMLAFGGKHFHADPKTGLALYGPYSLTGQTGPAVGTIKVGIVGPASMVADAEAWLQACRGMLTNDG